MGSSPGGLRTEEVNRYDAFHERSGRIVAVSVLLRPQLVRFQRLRQRPQLLRGASYLIVFDSAQHLLSDDSDDFGVLLRMLTDKHEQWRAVTTDFGARGEWRMAVQSVLACEPQEAAALSQRMRDVGAASRNSDRAGKSHLNTHWPKSLPILTGTACGRTHSAEHLYDHLMVDQVACGGTEPRSTDKHYE